MVEMNEREQRYATAISKGGFGQSIYELVQAAIAEADKDVKSYIEQYEEAQQGWRNAESRIAALEVTLDTQVRRNRIMRGQLTIEQDTVASRDTELRRVRRELAEASRSRVQEDQDAALAAIERLHAALGGTDDE